MAKSLSTRSNRICGEPKLKPLLLFNQVNLVEVNVRLCEVDDTLDQSNDVNDRIPDSTTQNRNQKHYQSRFVKPKDELVYSKPTNEYPTKSCRQFLPIRILDGGISSIRSTRVVIRRLFHSTFWTDYSLLSDRLSALGAEFGRGGWGSERGRIWLGWNGDAHRGVTARTLKCFASPIVIER